jgi:hypothetical protein
MKTKLHRLLIGLALSASLHQAVAQGTAFTYQGRLNDGTNPATGLYDFQFSLSNAPSGGSQVGSTLTETALAVTNGLFITSLDFGSVYTGSSFWLGISVRTNGAGSYVGLSPLQPLTPTPYAIFAETANASGLSGTVPLAQLPAGVVTNGASGVNFSGMFTGNGAGLTGVALLSGGNTLSGNQSINGRLLISDGSGVSNFTDVIIGPGGYNAGEQHSINFDDSLGHIGSLILGWDGANGYFTLGNLYTAGVHPTNTAAFKVSGNGNVNVDPMGMNSGFLNNGNTNSSGLTFGSGSGEGIASKRTAGGNQNGLDFYTGSTSRMSIANNGNVGIGTNSPGMSLDIEKVNSGGYGAVLGIANKGSGAGTAAAIRFGVDPSGIDGGLPGAGTDYPNAEIKAVNATLGNNETDLILSSWAGTSLNEVMRIKGATGNVGIGTTTPAYKLDVNGNVSIGGSLHFPGAGADTSTTVFTHQATAANVSGNKTYLNNPVCNGQPNAILIITENWHASNNVGNSKVVGVYYDAGVGEWTIFVDDGTAMPIGVAYNVMVTLP